MNAHRCRGRAGIAAVMLAMIFLLVNASPARSGLCWPPPAPLDLTTVAPADPPCAPGNIARSVEGPETLGLLGEKAWGPADEDFGQIVDVVVDRAGRPVAAVIDFGGFLGVGSRKIAIDWRALTFDPSGGHRVRLALGRAEIQGAPEYKRGAPVAEPPARASPPPTAPSPQGDATAAPSPSAPPAPVVPKAVAPASVPSPPAPALSSTPPPSSTAAPPATPRPRPAPPAPGSRPAPPSSGKDQPVAR